MFNPDNLTIWFAKLGLSEQAQKVINEVRSSQPSRHVQSGPRNVPGRYPSQKMGLTIQFESHTNELPYIYKLEHDKGVVEFYDQPPPIKLNHSSPDGSRKLGYFHTPDFFVLRVDGAGWEECKTEGELLELEAKNPNRYYRDEAGVWRCPPGEAYAVLYGLYYRVVSSAEIDWILLRNIEFLADYWSPKTPPVPADVIKTIQALVKDHPGIKLSELFDKIGV